MKLEFFYNIGIFNVNALMWHGVYLGGLHGSRLSLRRLVVFLDILFLILAHSMLDRIMFVCGVTCVILLTIMLIHALIMHDMFNLTLHYPETVLMLS